MSRTYQYRKVMKPMLERKRRARINKCLDELKDLMVGALQSEGETITKLEKADVLELTVRHLRKLRQHNALAIPAHNHAHDKFRAGFTQCANEVSRFVTAIPGVDMHVSTRLLSHLGGCIAQLDKLSTPAPSAAPSPATAPQQPSPASTPSSSPVLMPLTVSVPQAPRVYTPPASPESRPAAYTKPIQSSPHPVIVNPQPTVVSPQPTVVSPQPTLVSPQPVVPMKVAVPSTSPCWRPW